MRLPSWATTASGSTARMSPAPVRLGARVKAKSRARCERAESGVLMSGGSTATMDSDGGGVAGSRWANHHPADEAGATPNAMMLATTGMRRRREGAAAAGSRGAR